MQLLLQILSGLRPQHVWGFGGLLVFIGEIWGAIWDGLPGGTISEWYKNLPEWVKLALAGLYIGIFVHLIEWPIRDKEVEGK